MTAWDSQLASGETADVHAWIKTRVAREEKRRKKLQLRAKDVYPWLEQGNNLRRPS